jgi:hypothetical protein
MIYCFKDADSYHRIMRVTNASLIGAQCQLPIGTWQCIFKEDNDGYVYNSNTDNTWTRIN